MKYKILLTLLMSITTHSSRADNWNRNDFLIMARSQEFTALVLIATVGAGTTFKYCQSALQCNAIGYTATTMTTAASAYLMEKLITKIATQYKW